MEVTTLSSLKEIYRGSKENVFLIAALSPTWLPCLQGAQLVQEIFEENKSEILYGAIIWTRMLVTDNVYIANERETRFSDPRVMQFWDPDRIFGQLMSSTLHLKASIAWDVYLVYSPEHLWDAELPPAPAFWMHQLDEEPTLLLDPPRLKEYVQTLLERTVFQ